VKATVLSIAARYLSPLLLGLSLVVLYRGHNLPGGGFIGGLIAASAWLLPALADGWERVEARWIMGPQQLIVLGLAVAFLSAVPAVFTGQPFFTGLWLPAWEAPLLGKVKLGTPLLFDLGVYLTVTGFTLRCALSLGKEGQTWTS